MNRNPRGCRHSTASLTFILLAAMASLISATQARAQELSFQVDPAQSKVEYSLAGTMHIVHGTFAVKSGAIQYDPASGKIDGTIVVDATSGSSGNQSRDNRMHREILESAKFPEIVFSPTKLAGVVAADGISKVEISGRFRLHGQDHDVTLPAEVKANGKNLQVTTHVDIPYIKWGLKNPSNFLLHVSDTVNIEIEARGQVHDTGNP